MEGRETDQRSAVFSYFELRLGHWATGVADLTHRPAEATNNASEGRNDAIQAANVTAGLPEVESQPVTPTFTSQICGGHVSDPLVYFLKGVQSVPSKK
jgi:hypothetical protein